VYFGFTWDHHSRVAAYIRHRINATFLGDLADNAVVELHCFSHGIDGAADDNRLSTDAAFRRCINCGKGLCSIHRLRVLVSHLGSPSLNSGGSEVTSETVIQLLRTAHNERHSRRMKLIMEYLRFMPIPSLVLFALRLTQRQQFISTRSPAASF
jgi:hypothetical protein